MLSVNLFFLCLDKWFHNVAHLCIRVCFISQQSSPPPLHGGKLSETSSSILFVFDGGGMFHFFCSDSECIMPTSAVSFRFFGRCFNSEVITFLYTLHQTQLREKYVFSDCRLWMFNVYAGQRVWERSEVTYLNVDLHFTRKFTSVKLMSLWIRK